MKSSKDQIYIDKVLQGDVQAFSYLVDSYKDMAYTLALKIVRNAEDAEEVAQDSFIKAFQQLGTFKGKSKFSTWLYTIIYRTSISKTRKKHVAVAAIDDYVVNNFTADETHSQIEKIKYNEQQDYIKLAINKLSELDALLITLFYMNENSLDEIKEITGYSKANIKVRLFRARKRLYKELEVLLKGELRTIL